jgi:hypothetical protein
MVRKIFRVAPRMPALTQAGFAAIQPAQRCVLHNVQEYSMQRIDRNLQWIAENVILAVLLGALSWSAGSALARVLLLLGQGKTLDDFPVALWVLVSGMQTAFWTMFVVFVKLRQDKKEEMRRRRAMAYDRMSRRLKGEVVVRNEVEAE